MLIAAVSAALCVMEPLHLTAARRGLTSRGRRLPIVVFEQWDAAASGESDTSCREVKSQGPNTEGHWKLTPGSVITRPTDPAVETGHCSFSMRQLGERLMLEGQADGHRTNNKGYKVYCRQL